MQIKKIKVQKSPLYNEWLVIVLYHYAKWDEEWAEYRGSSPDEAINVAMANIKARMLADVMSRVTTREQPATNR